MELIDKNALSMELTNEVLNAYAKADFRFAHALNVFQGLIDKAPIVEERKQGYWIDVDLDTSICSICKNPQETVFYLIGGTSEYLAYLQNPLGATLYHLMTEFGK